MKKIKERIHTLGVQIFIFGLTLLLFNWPLMSVAHDKGPPALYIYLFLAWVLVILLTFLRAISIKASPQSESREEGGGDV